ncbi:hypothetical protein D3C79_725280 [compost metagenome]
MHVLADLGAGADGGPGVDHGAFIDEGADVDVGGHQHGIGGDEGAFASGRRRHHAYPGSLELLGGIVGKLEGNLVVILGVVTLDDAVVIDAEVEQYRLLQPLVYHPLAGNLLGDTGLAGIQQFDDLQDGGLGGGIDGAGSDGITAFEGRFDDLLQLGHDRFPLNNSVCCITLFQLFLRARADFFGRMATYCALVAQALVLIDKSA